MKIKLLITGVLSLATIAAFAQKGELKNADDKYGIRLQKYLSGH